MLLYSQDRVSHPRNSPFGSNVFPYFQYPSSKEMAFPVKTLYLNLPYWQGFNACVSI